MTTALRAAFSQVLSRPVNRPLPIHLPMSRNDLPVFCRERGYLRGAEIGVWKGAFSEKFCRANPSCHMLCVDPWEPHAAWLDTKNTLPPAEGARFMDAAYREALARLGPLNCSILRQFSAVAARGIPDRSLDFVFIDGNHVYDAVLEDLTLWAPKVRRGGIVAGHDYRVFANKPMIHVVAAVNAYTTAHAIDPWFVLAADKTPSFLWRVA